MVKDWGMSEKVGLRTIEGPKGLSSGDVLGPNTNEMVRMFQIFKITLVNRQKKIFFFVFTLLG